MIKLRPFFFGLKKSHTQFILHHQVMQQSTDDQVAVPMVVVAKKRFPNLTACSFDKGFHTPQNQVTLQEHLTLVAYRQRHDFRRTDDLIQGDISGAAKLPRAELVQ